RGLGLRCRRGRGPLDFDSSRLCRGGRGGCLLGRLLRLLGLFGLDVAAKTVAVSLAPDAVGLRVLDARGVALDPDTQLDAQGERPAPAGQIDTTLGGNAVFRTQPRPPPVPAADGETAVGRASDPHQFADGCLPPATDTGSLRLVRWEPPPAPPRRRVGAPPTP